MSKADDGLRALLQKHLPRSRYLWTVVETGGTHSGVPDSYYVDREGDGAMGWIESKATDGWAVEVRPHQVAWIRTHVEAGVRVLVAVRARGKGSSNGLGDALWIIKGNGIEALQEQGLRLAEEHVLLRCYGAPRSWDWLAVTHCLTL